MDEYNEQLKCVDAAGEKKSKSETKIVELRSKITARREDNPSCDKLFETLVEATELAVKLLTIALNSFALDIKNRPHWTESRIQIARDMILTIRYTKPVLHELEKGITFLDPISITRCSGI